MAFIPPKDRVQETSTSNSQTVFALAGASDASYNRFSAWMAVGDTTIGAVVEAGTAMKVGLLKYSNTNEITVTGTPYDSKGTFSAGGTKRVFMGFPAAMAASIPMRGYLAGLKLTYSSVTGFLIDAGSATDLTNDTLMTLASQYTKTTGAWVLGSAVGSLDVGTIAASKSYFPYLIRRSDTGVVDAVLSLAPDSATTFTMTLASPGVVTQTDHGLQANAQWTPTTTGALPTGLTAGTTYYVKTVSDVNTFTVSATQGGAAINTSGSQSGVHTGTSSPTLPANYDQKRRIGALKTDGSAQLISFTQNGDEFLWSTPVNDIAGIATVASAVSKTVTVPTGVQVNALIDILLAYASAVTWFYLSSLDQTDVAASATNFTLVVNSTGTLTTTSKSVRTNRSAQVRTRSDTTGGTYYFIVTGWIDRRGRDA